MLGIEQNPKLFDKNNPFLAKLTEKRALTGVNSDKETMHFVVDISGSGMVYESGDSLGVYPTNDHLAVDWLIKALGFCGDELVLPRKFDHSIPFRQALMHHFSLAGPTKKLLNLLYERG